MEKRNKQVIQYIPDSVEMFRQPTLIGSLSDGTLICSTDDLRIIAIGKNRHGHVIAQFVKAIEKRELIPAAYSELITKEVIDGK
jgi:hypothetical protein